MVYAEPSLTVFDNFLTEAEVQILLTTDISEGPLIQGPRHVFSLLSERLSVVTGHRWTACGPKLTFHDTQKGIHEHRDGAYMGGDFTLIVYLTTPESGGETVFTNGVVRPVAGRAALFGINDLHYGNASVGSKMVIAMEVVNGNPCNH